MTDAGVKYRCWHCNSFNIKNELETSAGIIFRCLDCTCLSFCSYKDGMVYNQSEQSPLRLTFDKAEYSNGQAYKRAGSRKFYELLEEMADTHDKKSRDYASNDNPFGNYHFAGRLARLFAHSPEDMGFIGRIGEKIYRLANLESSNKTPANESIEDTERDICVITLLWMADRRERRLKNATTSRDTSKSEASSRKCKFQISISLE